MYDRTIFQLFSNKSGSLILKYLYKCFHFIYIHIYIHTHTHISFNLQAVASKKGIYFCNICARQRNLGNRNGLKCIDLIFHWSQPTFTSSINHLKYLHQQILLKTFCFLNTHKINFRRHLMTDEHLLFAMLLLRRSPHPNSKQFFAKRRNNLCVLNKCKALSRI